MKKYGLSINELLTRMGIDRSSVFLDKKMLYDAVLKLDTHLTPDQISALVDGLLEGQNFIEIQDLIDTIEGYQSKTFYLKS
jgi:hypothetical protein